MNTFTILEDKHYDLLVIAVGSGEYAVAPSYEVAEAAAQQAIADILWTIDAERLLPYLCATIRIPSHEDAGLLKAIKLLQAELGEDANPIFKLLFTEQLPLLQEEMLSFEGLKALAPYDGDESFFGDVFEDAEVDLTECKKELLAATGAMNVEDLLFYRIR